MLSIPVTDQSTNAPRPTRRGAFLILQPLQPGDAEANEEAYDVQGIPLPEYSCELRHHSHVLCQADQIRQNVIR
jgi:hypothetical protein